jgi:hypothetical protein
MDSIIFSILYDFEEMYKLEQRSPKMLERVKRQRRLLQHLRKEAEAVLHKSQ